MTRVDIIGGGPAGAFTARLTALRYPDWTVRLFERLPPDDTFGFGVGLTRALLSAVGKADPAIHQQLLAAIYPFSSAEFRLPQGTVGFGQFHSGAIRRSELLRILIDGAREAGADVSIGAPADADELRHTADVVVGADGLSSATRNRYPTEFGASASAGRGVFIWCAADIELDGTVFEPVETPEGTFVAHAYPYAKGLSTFVIEASVETIRAAGFSDDRAWTSDNDSDVEALAYLSDAYSNLLKGGHFFGNRSRWSHFTTLQCANWSHQNVVLVGDAVATVHPSLGSGTKVALESAIALVDSFAALDTRAPNQVLRDFTLSRRPAVARLQDRAQRSRLWWESFPARMDLSTSRIAVAYLSRAGVVSLDSLAESNPELAAHATADFAGVPTGRVPARDLTRWVLDQPLNKPRLELPARILQPAQTDQAGSNGTAATIEVTSGDAWGPEGDVYVQRAHRYLGEGARLVVLTGGGGISDLMDRLAVAERIRAETEAAVGVSARADQEGLVADGIVAGRADLLALDPSPKPLAAAEAPVVEDDVVPQFSGAAGLSEACALRMLKAAVSAARELRAPSGVAIVDAAGVLRAWALMDGATPLASEIVPKKARTAAFSGYPTGALPVELSQQLAAASEVFVALPGGLPITIDGVVVGGIAVGGTSAANDVTIAQAALDSLTS